MICVAFWTECYLQNLAILVSVDVIWLFFLCIKTFSDRECVNDLTQTISDYQTEQLPHPEANNTQWSSGLVLLTDLINTSSSNKHNNGSKYLIKVCGLWSQY